MVADGPQWVRSLDLAPHPEGGWFKETWRSELSLHHSALPDEYTTSRNAGTAILFALLPGEESALHRVRSAELWFHHRGSPLILDIGADPSSLQRHVLGTNLAAGEQPQILVPPGQWQRARPLRPEPTLVSCVVVPGFDFADFELM